MYRILVLIEWFVPAYRAGGPIISMKNLIDNLKSEFDFWILTSNYDYPKVNLNVSVDKWIESDGVKVFYASSYKEVISQLRNLDYNLLMVNGIYSPVYSILPIIIGHKPILVFTRGMLSEHSLKIKRLKKLVFLKLAKLFGLYNGVVFIVNSEKEYYEVKALFPKNRVEIVENPVSGLGSFTSIEKSPGKLRLVSVARVSPVKNYEFGLKVLQKITQGEIIWDIYGDIESKNYYSRLRKFVSLLPSNVEVVFKGPIKPYDLKRTIAGYHFLFLPTYGENFGHSIFESFSVGRPVIISNNTPWRHLEQKGIGWDLPLDIELWRDVVLNALMLKNLEFQQMCKKSYQFAKDYIANSKQIHLLKRLIYEILNTFIK